MKRGIINIERRMVLSPDGLDRTGLTSKLPPRDSVLDEPQERYSLQHPDADYIRKNFEKTAYRLHFGTEGHQYDF